MHVVSVSGKSLCKRKEYYNNIAKRASHLSRISKTVDVET